MRVVILFFSALALPGCYSLGNPQVADPDVVAQIVPGETTKVDVLALVGRPTAVDFDVNEREKWLYTYTLTKVSGRQMIPIFGMFASPDTETHSLTILFDDDNVVRKVAGGEARSKDTLQGAGVAAKKKTTKKKKTASGGKKLGGAAS